MGRGVVDGAVMGTRRAFGAGFWAKLCLACHSSFLRVIVALPRSAVPAGVGASKPSKPVGAESHQYGLGEIWDYVVSR